MKLSQRSEIASEVFEGRTREEAVARAREALGAAAVVRCWKTRTGGLFGFFTREMYVAGVKAPDAVVNRDISDTSVARDDSETSVARDDSETSVARDDSETSVARDELTALRREPPIKVTPLFDLVEATNDEVTLGGELYSENVFSFVLAEAEAALNSSDVSTIDPLRSSTAVSPPVASSPVVDLPSMSPPVADVSSMSSPVADVPIASSPVVDLPSMSPPVADVPITSSPVADVNPMSSPVANSMVMSPPVHFVPREERSGLRESLVTLGIPQEHWADDTDFTFDGLERSLAKAPVAPSLPRHAGSLIVIVGSARDIHVVALQVAEQLGLEPTDVLKVEATSAGRQRVMRRRTTKRLTVLEVTASLRSRDLASTAAWITTLHCEYVLGAVAARAKSADVDQWRRQLGRLDAVSLLRANETSSPGELLGKIPIAFIDGAPATTLRWLLLVLHSMEEMER